MIIFKLTGKTPYVFYIQPPHPTTNITKYGSMETSNSQCIQLVI